MSKEVQKQDKLTKKTSKNPVTFSTAYKEINKQNKKKSLDKVRQSMSRNGWCDNTYFNPKQGKQVCSQKSSYMYTCTRVRIYAEEGECEKGE